MCYICRMSKHIIEVYPSRKVEGQWGWRVKDANGKRHGGSGIAEGYPSQEDAVTFVKGAFKHYVLIQNAKA